MRAGKLDQRVTIQSATIARDSYGNEVRTWSTLATVWAEVEPLVGREFMEGRQVESEVTTRIRIRYRTDLTTAMRAVHGSVTYDIVSVLNPDSDRRETQLMCREIG